MDRKVIVLGLCEVGIRDSTVKWERAVKIGHALDGRMFIAMYFLSASLTFPIFFFNFAVCKDPPYKVEESGYAGFILPIEVYFRNKVCNPYPLISQKILC